jgi:hypothetical protein
MPESFSRYVTAKRNRCKMNLRVSCSPACQRLGDATTRAMAWSTAATNSWAAGSLPGTTRRQTSTRQARRDESQFVYRPLRMAEICWRASAQATGFTLPESNSRMRRAISFCHCASAPSSTVSSRLSRSEPAKAPRAAGGRASAFFSSSESSSLIAAFYSRRAAARGSVGAAPPKPCPAPVSCCLWPRNPHLEKREMWGTRFNPPPSGGRSGFLRSARLGGRAGVGGNRGRPG